MRRIACLGVFALMLGVGGAALQAAEGSPERPLVQLALLLDTSGSMSGMITQAKTQLWSIVNEFISAKREGQRPVVHVALYQYGTPSLGAENGYIKQLLPLTDDLDKVSDVLFKLGTDGGEEYCGWVIKKATEELEWSTRPKDYKAIFIAGNERFNQGQVDFKESCKAAVAKGIIVNTIHCAGGEDTFWADGARLADGQFMRIDQNRQVVEIKAPQDVEIARLSLDLNKTYVPYGEAGKAGAENQAAQEANSGSLGTANSAQRAATKASGLYRNDQWDLVDASEGKDFKLENIKDDALPEEMRKLALDERKAYLESQRQARGSIQGKINELSRQRRDYVAAEEKKQAGANKDTLGEQVRAAVRQQASAKEFTFE